MSEVGFILRQLRLNAGMTQEAVAEGLDVSTNYVSMVERGDRKPSWRFLVSFANLLRVPVNDLLREVGLIDAPPVNEAEIAEIAAISPEFAELVDLAKEIAKEDPAKLAEIVRFAQWITGKAPTPEAG